MFSSLGHELLENRGAVYYLSNANLGNIEFDKLMTEWRNERRIKSNVGPISYLLLLTVLKRIYSKFTLLYLPFTDSPRLTLRNPNPKEVKILL